MPVIYVHGVTAGDTSPGWRNVWAHNGVLGHCAADIVEAFDEGSSASGPSVVSAYSGHGRRPNLCPRFPDKLQTADRALCGLHI
jgi:hypothetical protein